MTSRVAEQAEADEANAEADGERDNCRVVEQAEA